jgi:hypothetical protein
MRTSEFPVKAGRLRRINEKIIIRAIIAPIMRVNGFNRFLYCIYSLP